MQETQVQEARPIAGDTVAGEVIAVGRIEGTLTSTEIVDRFLQLYNYMLLQCHQQNGLGAV